MMLFRRVKDFVEDTTSTHTSFFINFPPPFFLCVSYLSLSLARSLYTSRCDMKDDDNKEVAGNLVIPSKELTSTTSQHGKEGAIKEEKKKTTTTTTTTTTNEMSSGKTDLKQIANRLGYIDDEVCRVLWCVVLCCGGCCVV